MSHYLHQDHGQPDEVTYAKQDEARREAMRQKIAAMFGEDTKGFDTLVREGRSPSNSVTDKIQRGLGSPLNVIQPGAGVAREMFLSGSGDDPIYAHADPLSGDPARKQFSTEETDLSGALRGNYGDDLKQRYADAERAVRFGAANTGNIGSTTYADAQAKLNRENTLGGTNIEEAVRRAITNLRTSREQVRTQALDLVNAGQGDEGVRSATAGINSTLANAKAAGREQLFNDLFTNLAYTRVGQNNASQSAQLAAILNRGNGSFFPSSASSGRIIS